MLQVDMPILWLRSRMGRCATVVRVFCMPGESYLVGCDGLYNGGIEIVIGRKEGGVAVMAEAYGKLTGPPTLRLSPAI